MLTKAKLTEQIQNLPEEFSIDELFERLIFIDKTERSNKQSEKNEVISEIELQNEMKEWFK